MNSSSNCPDPVLEGFLVRQSLLSADESAVWTPMTGGVSSDIWRVDVAGRSFCVKRALSQLKVAADWKAPLSRNSYEWSWLQFASRHFPDNVPTPLAHDENLGVFAMSFLDPAQHPNWKTQLLAGVVQAETARDVGALIGRLHAVSAGSREIASAFETLGNFYALRLEPYLVATAARHPELAPALIELVAITAGTQHALVHGDVSPKNVLVGPRGPILLDAECAWYGDPAFDIAFCLNHLLLKGLVRHRLREPLKASVEWFVQSYFAQVSWEPRSALERRAARLVPALMLARVDGKSPVEYLTENSQRALVRAVAGPLLQAPPMNLAEVIHAWNRALGQVSDRGDETGL